MKKIKKLMAVCMAAVWCVLSLPETGEVCFAQEAEDISLYAGAAVLMDADSGRVLFEKNGSDVMAMASTTKILTCIVTLENGNPDESLEISSYAASMPKVKLYVKKGEQYVLRDLLHSLMLESHNDSAVAIAEYIGKGFLPEELRNKSTSEFTAEESKQAVAAFARLMNQKALDIGCENSWFITPNGLDATETITLESGETIVKEHGTTARDLARIMSYCITKSPKKQEFLDITRTANYSFSANGRSYSCVNHNSFLTMMDGALSGKTGFTNKAGYCYVGSVKRDGKTLVVALLACGWPNHKTYKWNDTRELMDYGLENYTYHAFAEAAYEEEKLTPIPVSEGQTRLLGQTAYTGLRIAGRTGEGAADGTDGQGDAVTGTEAGGLDGLLMRDDERIEVSCEVKNGLEAPVEAGTQVGTISYSVNGQVYKTEQIVTTTSVGKIDLPWCIRQIWERFAII